MSDAVRHARWLVDTLGSIPNHQYSAVERHAMPVARALLAAVEGSALTPRDERAEIERLDRANPPRDEKAVTDNGWQPIETAPKDGTAVLLHVDWEPLTVVGFFGSFSDDPMAPDAAREQTWRVKWDCEPIKRGYDEPTHWMPLRVPDKTFPKDRGEARPSLSGREGDV